MFEIQSTGVARGFGKSVTVWALFYFKTCPFLQTKWQFSYWGGNSLHKACNRWWLWHFKAQFIQTIELWNTESTLNCIFCSSFVFFFPSFIRHFDHQEPDRTHGEREGYGIQKIPEWNWNSEIVVLWHYCYHSSTKVLHCGTSFKWPAVHMALYR